MLGLMYHCEGKALVPGDKRWFDHLTVVVIVSLKV